MQDHSSSCFWYLSLVGEFNPGAYVIFLLRGTGVCPLVEGAGSYPSGGQGRVEGSTVHSH